MNKKVGIIGMGWLGLPLAQHLKLLGYNVTGSVSRLERATTLQKNGFEVYPITFTENGVQGSLKGMLKDTETIVIMIPPGLRRNTGSDYVMKMSHLLSATETTAVKNCIFVSSTSVYGDRQEHVTEKDVPKPENEAGRQLFQTEQLFFTSKFNTSIVRFGGLYGGSRQPARYLAGRENLSGGDAPVNLIHRDDCIQIITKIIKQNAYGHIFNAVNPSHPTKKDYYTKIAKQLELIPPHYASSKTDEKFKQVDSIHLKEIIDFSFSEAL